jgi:hypothetical protein
MLDREVEDAVTSHREALLWAVVASAQPQAARSAAADLTPVPVSALIAVASAHRITSRLVALAAHAPSSFTSEQLSALRAVSEADDQHAACLSDELSELARRCAVSASGFGGKLIHLKGNSAAHHLSPAGYRRHSNDIDLISTSPETLISVMSLAGFRRHSEGMCHEASTMVSPNGKFFDVHRYFPAWQYVEAGSTPYLTKSRRLDYRDLVAGAVPDPDVSREDVLIPGPEMTAILLCFHVFKDYIEPPFLTQIAKVKMGELAEFLELHGMIQFDRVKFMALATEYGGRDAVEFVTTVIKDLGLSLDITQVRRLGAYKREIIRGIAHEEAFDAKQLLIRNLEIEPDIPAKRITIGRRGQVGLVDTRENIGVKRNTQSLHPPLEIRASISVSKDHDVTLRIATNGRSACHKDEVTISIGSDLLRVQRTVDGGHVSVDGGTGDASVAWKDHLEGYVMTLVFPHLISRRILDRNRTSSLLIGAQMYSSPITEDWNEMYESSLVSSMAFVTVTTAS